VVAHDLVHLRHGHPEKASEAGGWLIWAGIFVFGFVAMQIHALATAAEDILPELQLFVASLFQFRFGFVLLLLLAATWIRNFRRRSYEEVADCEDVTIVGGDAAAGMTALIKLARLNLHPLEWGRIDRNLLTHPSQSRRIQAIVDDNDIDPEQEEEILARVDEDQERYPLPSHLIQEESVFHTEYKIRRSRVLTWSGLVFMLLLPALLVRVIEIQDWTGPLEWAALGVALVVNLVAVTIFLSHAVVWGEARLQKRLKAKLKGSGIDLEAWQCMFVGFAPARAPRIYESTFDWDMGFLVIAGERLCFFDCNNRFSLRWNQVSAIRTGPGAPRWGKSGRVYLTWCDDQGTETTWNLRPAGTRSVGTLQRQVPFLLQMLEDWQRQRPAGTALPELIASSQPPAFGKVTSASVASYSKLHPLQKSLLLGGLLSGGIAFLLGSSFLYFPLGRGWFAPALACLLVVIARVPIWLYREPRATKSSSGPV
jgi:hypothetical protein